MVPGPPKNRFSIASQEANYGQHQTGALPYLAVLLFACGTVALMIPITWVRVLGSLVALATVGLFALFFYFNHPDRQLSMASNMVKLTKPPQKAMILDLGSGRGLTSIAFAKAFPDARVIGIDLYVPISYPSGIHVEDAERNARIEGVDDRVEFRKADIRDIPYGDSTFHIVTCRNALFTLNEGERMRALLEVFRVLRPGGVFIWAEPPPPMFWSLDKAEMVALEAGFSPPEYLRAGLGAMVAWFAKP